MHREADTAREADTGGGVQGETTSMSSSVGKLRYR